jgi:hypothetical protein
VASLKDGESPVKIRRCRATVKLFLVEPECPPVSLDCSLRVKREGQQVLALCTTLACMPILLPAQPVLAKEQVFLFFLEV